MLPRILIVMTAAVAFSLFLGVAGVAHAVIYDETANGEFSQDRTMPTSLGALGAGDNLISGATGTAADRDYFTFAVPSGFTLSAINVLTDTTAGGAREIAFIALERGTQITLLPNVTTAAGLLGWWHYGEADIGSDILAKMSVPAQGSSGFTPPLGPDNYAVWIQDADNPGSFPYHFDFVVAAVPEPASGAAMLTGLALLAVRRRLRRS